MADYKYPKPVKLIIPILGKDQNHINTMIDILSKEFGTIEAIMDPIQFEWTNYYEEEVGDSPIRTIIAFKELVNRENLVEFKRRTNELETETFNGQRLVNLDPGYLTLGQFFLATTKDQRQRVYVANGIFIDPTLYFQAGAFHWYDWTYYDYRSPIYHQFLLEARKVYHKQLKSIPQSN